MKDNIRSITIRGEFLLAAVLVLVAFTLLRLSKPTSMRSTATLTIFTDRGKAVSIPIPPGMNLKGAAYE